MIMQQLVSHLQFVKCTECLKSEIGLQLEYMYLGIVSAFSHFEWFVEHSFQ